MSGKNVREELAELTEAVRELRDREVADTLRNLRAEVEKLRAERAAHHGCTCMHIHWQPYTWTVPQVGGTYPNYVVTSGNTCVSSQTAGASTTLSISN